MSMFTAAESGESVSKQVHDSVVPELREALLMAQHELKSKDYPLLVLLDGDDRPGCNDVLNLLHEWMDARFLTAAAFGKPTPAERRFPPFQRYWRVLPPKGRAGVIMRGWAVDAVRERVLGDLDDDGLDDWIGHIRCLEEMLLDDNAVIVKLWLHLPRAEHKKRLKKKRSLRGWRLDKTDRLIYELFDKALEVVEHVLERTTANSVPWRVIDATDSRHRDLSVGRAVLDALRARLDTDGTAARDAADRVTVGVTAGVTAGADPHPGPAHEPAAVISAEGPRGPDGLTVLDELDLTLSLPKDAYRQQLAAQQKRLLKLGRKLGKKRSLVLGFEGWDAAGKGGAIRRITKVLDARFYRVVPIAAPTEEEREHHHLWRFWRHIPPRGRATLFDRTWYGRVLVERIEGFATPEAWRRAYAEIRDFEAQLIEAGAIVLKFWLHIDPEEQLRRFEARRSIPYKAYKLTEDDYRNREKWRAYEQAADDMVRETQRPEAPWVLVPANDKRWARVAVLRAVCDHLQGAL